MMNATAETMGAGFSPEGFFEALGRRLSRQLALATACGRCMFVVLGGGPRYVLDARSEPMLRRGVSANADTILITNAVTLEDLCAGTFDVENPQAHHVFLVAGDEKKVAALRHLLAAARPRNRLHLQIEESMQ